MRVTAIVEVQGMEGIAFASDYDGTLVEGVDHIEPDDVEAIRRFQRVGGLFGACSGRALNCVLEPAEKAEIPLDFAVVTSGALVLVRGKTVEEHPLDRTVVEALVGRYADANLGVHTATRFLVDFGPTSPNQTKVDDLLTALDEPAYGVSVNLGDERRAAAAARDISERFSGLVDAFQNVGSVDVVSRGCSKGAGLRAVRQVLGVSCLAGIGDSYNDMPLLETADVAYTFHASPTRVRAHAEVLVDSVAEALEDFSRRASR